MTKEQAIEVLEKIDVKFFISGMTEQKDYIIDKADEVNVAIETVLPMLEEKDKQIDKLKKHNDRLLKKLRNRVKEVEKLQKYSLYKQEFSKLNKQLQNKDKIIDLMAETINNHDIDEDICKQMGQKEDCNEFKDKEKCKYCIKQYFENKAKEVN